LEGKTAKKSCEEEGIRTNRKDLIIRTQLKSPEFTTPQPKERFEIKKPSETPRNFHREGG